MKWWRALWWDVTATALLILNVLIVGWAVSSSSMWMQSCFEAACDWNWSVRLCVCVCANSYTKRVLCFLALNQSCGSWWNKGHAAVFERSDVLLCLFLKKTNNNSNKKTCLNMNLLKSCTEAVVPSLTSVHDAYIHHFQKPNNNMEAVDLLWRLVFMWLLSCSRNIFEVDGDCKLSIIASLFVACYK